MHYIARYFCGWLILNYNLLWESPTVSTNRVSQITCHNICLWLCSCCPSQMFSCQIVSATERRGHKQFYKHKALRFRLVTMPKGVHKPHIMQLPNDNNWRGVPDMNAEALPSFKFTYSRKDQGPSSHYQSVSVLCYKQVLSLVSVSRKSWLFGSWCDMKTQHGLHIALEWKSSYQNWITAILWEQHKGSSSSRPIFFFCCGNNRGYQSPVSNCQYLGPINQC